MTVNLFHKIKKVEADKKLYRISELYGLALSRDTDEEVAFLLLMTCLEILYLPNNNGELTFRLSVYIANTLSKYSSRLKPYRSFLAFRNLDAQEIFDKVSILYKIRSQLVHTGCIPEKNRDQYLLHFVELSELVRFSIIVYIDDANIFTEPQLRKNVLT